MITGTYKDRYINAWGWERFWKNVDEDAAIERLQSSLRNEEIDEVERHDSIQKNYAIIKKCKLKFRDKESLWRKRFAVYRLYRFLDVPIEEIAYETKIKADNLRYMIGQVFSYLCMKDRECVLKKYLKVKVN